MAPLPGYAAAGLASRLQKASVEDSMVPVRSCTSTASGSEEVLFSRAPSEREAGACAQQLERPLGPRFCHLEAKRRRYGVFSG